MVEYRLHFIDIMIIALYAVFIIGKGIYWSRKHRNADDYFLAGRAMTWPLIGASLYASNLSSTTLVGLAGSGYGTGISVFNYEWMAAVILVFFAIFFLPLYLRSKVYTMPEFLEKRYDSRARYYFSLLTLLGNIIVDTAGSLYAGGLVLKMIFPQIPMWETVLVMAVLAGAYTIAGGLVAVIYTDAVQAFLLQVGAIIIAIFAFLKIGDWQTVLDATPKEMLSLVRPLDDGFMPWLGLVTGVPLLGFYFWCTNQFMVQRVLSAKNVHHGRLGAIFAGFLKIPVIWLMVLPGTMARVLYPGLENPDMVYPMLIFDMLPIGILGLVLASFLAALMSQVDSTLNSASTLVTMDFVKKFKPGLSGSSLMWVGRGVTLVFMILAAAWAPHIEKFGSLFKYLQNVLSYIAPPIVAVFILGVFWKRANASGAFASLLAGLVLAVLLLLFNQVEWIQNIHFLYMGPILFIICSGIHISVSLVTKPPPLEKTSSFTWSRKMYTDETVKLKSSPWYYNYRILSLVLLVFTFIVVVIYW